MVDFTDLRALQVVDVGTFDIFTRDEPMVGMDGTGCHDCSFRCQATLLALTSDGSPSSLFTVEKTTAAIRNLSGLAIRPLQEESRGAIAECHDVTFLLKLLRQRLSFHHVPQSPVRP